MSDHSPSKAKIRNCSDKRWGWSIKRVCLVIALACSTLTNYVAYQIYQDQFISHNSQIGEYLFELNEVPKDGVVLPPVANSSTESFLPVAQQQQHISDKDVSADKQGNYTNSQHQKPSSARKFYNGSADKSINQSKSPHKVPRAPVVIIPGSMGSILEAKLNKTHTQSVLCSTTSDWYTLWLSESAFVTQACFFDNIKLRYVGEGRTEPVEGVKVRVPFFGPSTSGVYCMLPQTKSKCRGTPNWKTVIDHLLHSGYSTGVDLFSAPYDFRQGPDDYMVNYFPKLQKLIEQAYHASGSRKVKLASVSLGGPITHTFLTHFVDQEWKDSYVHSWLSLAGVFNGFALSFNNVVFGRKEFLQFPLFKETDVRDAFRTWFSANWLIPKPIYGDNRVILETPTKQYRLSDIPNLLHGEQREMYLRSFRYNSTADPGVPVDCWYSAVKENTVVGHKITTEMSSDVFYSSSPTVPTHLYGIGDGSADAESLTICKKWPSTRSFRNLNQCHGCLLGIPSTAHHLEVSK